MIHNLTFQNKYVLTRVIKPLMYLNVLLTRHEDEDVSYQPTEVDLQGLLYCCLYIVFLRSLKHKTQYTIKINIYTHKKTV